MFKYMGKKITNAQKLSLSGPMIYNTYPCQAEFLTPYLIEMFKFKAFANRADPDQAALI